MQNLTPLEAARVLYKCEQRLRKAILEEDLVTGKLGKYLQPDDYLPIKQVSNFFRTFGVPLFPV